MLLASCGHRVSAVGPLVEGEGSFGMCMRAGDHTSFVLGLDALQNRGTTPVTVDRVRLDNAVNLALTDARLGPIHRPRPVGLMGMTQADPASFDGQQRSVWNASTSAVGAVIRSSRYDDQNLLVVVRLTDTARSGRTGIVVDYHDDARGYEWHDHGTYEVLVDTRCSH